MRGKYVIFFRCKNFQKNKKKIKVDVGKDRVEMKNQNDLVLMKLKYAISVKSMKISWIRIPDHLIVLCKIGNGSVNV